MTSAADPDGADPDAPGGDRATVHAAARRVDAVPPDGDATAPPPPVVPDDWPRQATDHVVRVVDAVRDKTTGPIINVTTVVVYGLVAATAMTILAVLLGIAAVRGLTLLLWDRAWAAYLVLGSITTLGGLLCWVRRPRLRTRR